MSVLTAACFAPGCGDSSASGGRGSGGDTSDGGNGGEGATGAGNPTLSGMGGDGGDGGTGGVADLCGNRELDAGEDCDGNQLDDETCATLGFDSGDLACSATCSFDTSNCVAAECGDGAVNGNEDCDGNLLDGETCVTQGFDSGTLACSGTCSFNTAGCVNRSCGDMIINGTEDCDGAQLGVGTCATEGFDGGTIACAANCSYNTAGCANENCVDAVDNDGDALVDCLDTSCTAECADACNTVPTIAVPGTVNGNTTGHADALTTSCSGTSGPETVYQATAAIAGFMHVTLTSATADHGISAWMGCPSSGTQIPGACEDLDFGANGVETISFPVTAGQVVHLMVDGFNNGNAGTYSLSVATVAAAACGDGFTDGTETCDDGNTAPNDGCSSNCILECGDGNIDGTEACDDGNVVAGDGCSPTCTLECGNATCGVNEDSCTCPADCPDDPDGCSACQCGQFNPPGNTCACDTQCIQFGDCCANETASCGVQQATFNFSSTATALAYNDGTYNGTQATMACKTLNTIAEGTITSVNSVTVATSHTWIGDITFKLISPTGTVMTLMSLPGTLEALDNGASLSSESSNLLVANPITFINTAIVSAENMGNTIGDTGNVCAPAPGDGICSFLPNAGAAVPNGGFSLFNGQVPTGDWLFCAGDSVNSDTGAINTVSINMTIGG